MGKKNEYRKDKCKKQHSCATGVKTIKKNSEEYNSTGQALCLLSRGH